MFFKFSKFFLYATVFNVALVTTSTLFPFIVGKYVWFRSAIDISLIFFLLGLVFDADANAYKKRFARVLRSPLAITVGVFVLAFVVAGFFGIDPSFSFWSNFERGEGGIQMLHLYAFFILLVTLFRSEKEWRKLFLCVMVAAVLMILYGVGSWLKYIDGDTDPVTKQLTGGGGSYFQMFSPFIGPPLSEEGYRFQGSIGNSAYVAAYLIFVLFYSLYSFLTSKAKAFSPGWFVRLGFIALFLTFFFLAATRGAFVGLLVAVLALFGYLAYSRKSWRRWLLAGGAAMLILVALLVQFRDVPFIKNIPGSRVFDLSFYTQTFQTRTIMWSIAFDAWKHRPILGYGPESFIFMFDKYFDTRYFSPSEGFGAWFDRAHSVIFDYLAESGIVGLVSYLAIFGVAVFLVFRAPEPKLPGGGGARDDPPLPIEDTSLLMRGLFLAMPVAYLVQGLILFDVLTIHWNVFLFLAFIAHHFIPKVETEHGAEPALLRKPALTIIAPLGILLALAAIIFGSYLPLKKARLYISASRNLVNVKSIPEFAANFDRVFNYYSPVGDEEVVKFVSSEILGAVTSGRQGEPISRALTEYIGPHLHKENVRHLMIGGRLYFSLWRLSGKESDYYAAEEYFRRAHEIGPKLPTPLYALLELYGNAGKKNELQEIAATIFSLWPQDPRLKPFLPQ